jgi:DnaJ domain
MAAQERNLTVPQALEILSLAPSASQDEVHTAWRKAARRTHPDQNPGNPQLARKRFDQVQEAYRVLTDPSVAAERQLATAMGPQPPYRVDQLEAFRVLSLGPRATYAEIDARLTQMLNAEIDTSKRNNYQAAHDLLTKPHREAQQILGVSVGAGRTGSLRTRSPASGNSPSGMSATLYVLIGLGLVVGALLLITSHSPPVIAEAAMAVGALICFVGAVRWIA